MNLLREFHGPNAAYIIELYERYRQDPESVDASTREQFSHWTPPVDGVTDGGAAPAAVVPSTQVGQIVHTANLAQAIREYGHLDAQLDPLGLCARGDPSLELETYALTEESLHLLPASLIGGSITQQSTHAWDAIQKLRAVYSSTIGYDYNHIRVPEERGWLRDAAEEIIPMSRRRRTIAKRLVEAQQTAAMLTTFNEIDMSTVISVRGSKKEAFEARHGVRLGFMSFFVKAAIGGLKDFPLLNAEIRDDNFVVKRHYDIGMAVGAEEGLVVPVLRAADQMSFAGIEKTIRILAGKARDGSLAIEDLRGGTFTITNGGVFGSLLSTPILNPPQVGILGLHKIDERPIAINGEVVIRPMMYVALSYDHRIVDGSEAVRFLVRVKELIEDPTGLLLDG